MSQERGIITIEVVAGPTVTIPWFQGMDAQQALEGAWAEIGRTAEFTYALQYYGAPLGYLVSMVNETYDTFESASDPFFYWQFSVNGNPSETGIDNTTLAANDVISFSYELYDASTHAGSSLAVKHNLRRNARKNGL